VFFAALLLACLTTIIAIGFQARLATTQYETRIWLESVGGYVVYGNTTPPRLLDLFSKEPVFDTIIEAGITSGSPPLDRGKLEILPSLRGLRIVKFELTDLVNDDLKVIGKCRHLEELSIRGSSVTTPGLRHLEGLKNLRKLDLQDCDISAKAIERLSSLLPQLKIHQQERDE